MEEVKGSNPFRSTNLNQQFALFSFVPSEPQSSYYGSGSLLRLPAAFDLKQPIKHLPDLRSLSFLVGK